MKPHRAARPDHQRFDEVRIVTYPRWKESEHSGDEWRISAHIEFLSGGKVIATANGGRDIETAILMLGYHSVMLEGAYNTSRDDICDQEGCSQKAERAFRLKKGYNRDGSNRELHPRGEYRAFCSRHAHRGDCGLEDADNNYDPIPMPE